MQQPRLVAGEIRPGGRERGETQTTHETLHSVRAEHGGEERGRVRRLERLPQTFASPRVVLGAKVRVRQHLVRLADDLKLRRRVGIVRILIRVKPPRREVIRALDLSLRRRRRHAERLVQFRGRHRRGRTESAGSFKSLGAGSRRPRLGASRRAREDFLVRGLRESQRLLHEVLRHPLARVRIPSFTSVRLGDGFGGVGDASDDLRDAHGDADGGKDDGGRDAGAEAFEKTGRAARARADDGRGDERGGAAEDALADGLETAGDARRRVAGSSKRKDVVEVQLCPREVTGRSASERAAGEGWTSRKGGGRAMETGRGSTKRRTRDGNRSGFDEAADARWKPVGAGRTSPCASPEATLVGTPAYAVSARDASAITRSPAASPPLDDDGSDMPRAWTARRGKGGRARRDLAGGHLRATTRLVA